MTYNDKACPCYLGRNCFDYEDLRDLFTGGFRKQLLRKYGCTFKYFVGAELGDGKGKRGLFNNPHYHILFFVVSACDDRFPYVQISPEDFRHLVRLYWQGFDEDLVGWHSYKSAKYGIAREGDNCGLVTDFRACVYCAKYCVKDVGLRNFEAEVSKVLRFNLSSQYSGDELELKVKEGLNYYRNRYTNKVRISHGVGDYALDFISDKFEPRIQIPYKSGFKNRPIGMYYYRKLFTDVYKDESGSNIRVLNELGIQYKLHKLPKRLDDLVSKTSGYLALLNRDLFDKMVSSDVNTDVTFSFDDFVRMFCQEHSEKILSRYAEYKLVYKERYFFFDRDKYCLPDCYPLLIFILIMKGSSSLHFLLLIGLIFVLPIFLISLIRLGYLIVHTHIFCRIFAFLLCLICVPIISLSRRITKMRERLKKKRELEDSLRNVS